MEDRQCDQKSRHDKRKKDLNNILNMIEDNNDTAQVKDIHKMYPETKNYYYVKSNELYNGMIIRYIDLDMEKISIACIVLKILYSITGLSIKSIMLKSMDNEIIWKIKPNKCYIFEIPKDKNIILFKKSLGIK
jgi:hypothetical protein